MFGSLFASLAAAQGTQNKFLKEAQLPLALFAALSAEVYRFRHMFPLHLLSSQFKHSIFLFFYCMTGNRPVSNLFLHPIVNAGEPRYPVNRSYFKSAPAAFCSSFSQKFFHFLLTVFFSIIQRCLPFLVFCIDFGAF